MRIIIFLWFILNSAFAAEVSLPPAEGPVGSEEALLFGYLKTNKIDEVLRQLEKPLQLNVRDKEMMTPLIMAIMAGNAPLASKMVEKGAKVDFPGRVTYMNVGTPLAAAAIAGNLEMVELLLQKGASVRGERGHLNLAPTAAAVLSKKTAVLVRLIKAGADPNELVQFETIGPLLNFAVQQKSLEMVQILLDSGARVNELDVKQRTALSIARQAKVSEIAKLLVSKGAKETLTEKEKQGTHLEAIRKTCDEPDPAMARELSKFLSKELTLFCANTRKTCANLNAKTLASECPAAPAFFAAWDRKWENRCPGFRAWEPCQLQWGVDIVCSCDESELVGAKFEFGCRTEGSEVICQSRNTLQNSAAVIKSEIPPRYLRAKSLVKKLSQKTEVALVTTREGSGSSTAEVIRLKRFHVKECEQFLNAKSTIHDANDIYAMCLLEVAEATGNPSPCRLAKGRNLGISEYDCAKIYGNRTGDVRGCLNLNQKKRARNSSSSEVLACIGDSIRVNSSAEGCAYLKRVLGPKDSNTRYCFAELQRAQ